MPDRRLLTRPQLTALEIIKFFLLPFVICLINPLHTTSTENITVRFLFEVFIEPKGVSPNNLIVNVF